MKILQTPVRFYPFVGGVENYVYHLSRELVKAGHDVRVICAKEPETTIEEIDGIKIERLEYTGKIANTNITPSLPLHILKEDFELIHTHLPTPWSSDWSAFVSKVKKKPLVLTYHNDIVGSGAAGHIANVYNKTVLILLLKRAEKIIVTHPDYLEFSRHLQGYREKTEVVPAGVDVEKFHPGDSQAENTIFFLSLLDEFHRYKGLDYLLEAVKLAKKEIPQIKLKVGGGGRLLEYYKMKAAALGLGENTDFLGYVPDKMIPWHYRNCSLFVLPSISAYQEGFGMVLLEALSSGKPVIGTDIVGLSGDIEKYKTGIVVKPKDTEALAEAIIRVLQDKKEAERMGKNGRKLVETKYSWKGIARDIGRIYSSLEV